MWIINNRKYFFALSGLLAILSIVAMFSFGFNFGIDFTGGSITEVTYSQDRPELESIKEVVNENGEYEGYSVRSAGESGYVIRTKQIDETKKNALVELISFGNIENITIERFNSIGPVAGEELRNKSYIAIAAVILAILLFVIFAFRKVSEPVPSWKYGIATIIALLHDVLIPTGIFVVLGHVVGMEIDLLFVAALLSIMGYSVNDTIVVFDRVRENLLDNKDTNLKEPFDETVGRGLMQTMARSINTSVTTITVLVFLYFFGGEATKNFSLILLMGMIAGTYSSIFLASPLLVKFAGGNKEE
jgi:preprotein translocase subunit SecF